MVARAPAVDIVGGRFRVPFGPEATWMAFPLSRLSDVRSTANAGVSRAAWFLSRNQPDSAEAALRMIVSLGFALVDNATTAIEQISGDIVVGIGKEGLRNFYTVRHDPRATQPVLQSISAGNVPAGPHAPPGNERQWFMARATDPRVPRGERMEILRSLQFASCSNVKEMLFGPSEDLRNAMQKGRELLSRFPSERALVELNYGNPNLKLSDFGMISPTASVVVSAATVAGTVLHNDRLATCSIINYVAFPN
jgi:hypothetical protein